MSVQMLCNRAGLTLRVRVMTCLSSFPKNELKGGSETSSCVRCSNQLCTRGQPPHGRVCQRLAARYFAPELEFLGSVLCWLPAALL